MNWESILTEVILSVLGLVFTALGGLVSYWISKKIKDDRVRGFIESLHELVKNAVLEVYQTYVEALKDGCIFDKEAQKSALEKALAIIKANMPAEVESWLKENYSDFEGYMKTLIEAQIASLKR